MRAITADGVIRRSTQALDNNFEANSIFRKNDGFYTESELKALANNIKYCGPSPDEISLLTGCKDNCGFFFTGSDAKQVIIQTPHEKFSVQKLMLNEFESDRKMMSVVIKYREKGRPAFHAAVLAAAPSLTGRLSHVQRRRHVDFVSTGQASLRVGDERVRAADKGARDGKNPRVRV